MCYLKDKIRKFLDLYKPGGMKDTPPGNFVQKNVLNEDYMRTSLKDYLPLIVLLSLLMSGNSTTACPPSADIEISRVSDEVTSL